MLVVMKSLILILFAVLIGTASTSLQAQLQAPKTPQERVNLQTRNIQEDPSNEFGYYERGRTHASMGNFEEAIKDLNYAIELNPNFGAAYYDRALLILGTGKKAEAIEQLIISATIDRDERNQDYPPEAYKKIVELDPKDFRGHRGLGYTKLFAPEQWPFYDEAVAHFTTALLLNPKDADTLKWRGTAYLRLEKFQLAVVDLTKAIALRPSEELYNLRADAYEKLKKAPLAIADRKKAETLSPEPSMKRGAAARMAGNLELAIQEYSKAIDLGSTKAYRERGKAYNRLYKYDLAIADFKEARVWHYDDFEVELGRGESYDGLGQAAKALSAYDRVVRHTEDKTAKLFALGKRAEILIEINKPQLAAKDLHHKWRILCEQGNKVAADMERKRLVEIGFKQVLTCP